MPHAADGIAGRWVASRRRTARRPSGPAGPAPQPGENRIGRSARSISWHARCGPHAGGPRPSPQPSPVPLAASAACPPGLVPPPGTGCGQPRRRLRSGGLEVVTIGPLRSPVRVLEDLRERDPAPGPSQNHPISIPPPGPGAPRGRGGQAVVHRCDCRPGMTSCHQVAGQPRRDSHAAAPRLSVADPRQTAIRHAGGIRCPAPPPATLSSPGTPRALAGPAALTGTIRAVRRTFQPGHLVVDRPDDRPFARMRRFRPPGVARLGLVI